MDFTNLGAAETLKWVLAEGSPLPPPGGLFVKLHIGDPGADGIQNPAIEERRVLAAWAAIAVEGTAGGAAALTSGDLLWTVVSTTETYTHVSFWTAITDGDCWYKGAMVAPVPVIAGSNFKFPAGSKLTHT
ncbi:MAG: hypothetical protein DRH08_01260 [Deltaproteobacteria bacterium]|nr:MAG: hypothetical protein DRH08_01260 [Deltaproteobacteria bacterium]